MTLTTSARQRLLFGFLCLVWGTTWLAMKTGISVVPPAFFSGLRWTAAGLILVLWRSRQGARFGIPRRLWPRLVLVALLMVAFNATIQLYGLRHVGSGLASVLTSGSTPVSLLVFGIIGGQERFSWPQAGAIALGLVGLFMLFGPAAWSGELGAAEFFGALGVLGGSLCYCLGSVLARPLMRTVPPSQLAALSNLVGGGTLLVGALLFEPGAWSAASLGWGWRPWLAWWFLLLPGSLGATIIYFQLVRDWGASMAGTYAFVSPVIAVFLGMAVYDERLRWTDVVGIVTMLAAAGVALRRPPIRVPDRARDRAPDRAPDRVAGGAPAAMPAGPTPGLAPGLAPETTATSAAPGAQAVAETAL